MLLDVKDKEKMVQDDRDVDMRLSPPMMKVFQRQRLIIQRLVDSYELQEFQILPLVNEFLIKRWMNRDSKKEKEEEDVNKRFIHGLAKGIQKM